MKNSALRRNVLFHLSALLFCSSCQYERGFEVYRVKEIYPDPKAADCHYCLDPTKDVLFDEPLIERSDVEYFDWNSQRVQLNEAGRAKIQRLKIPLEGLPVAVVVDGKPIYGFWLWNLYSSFGCDSVYTYPMLGFKIGFGLPDGNTYGEDPRFDNRLKDCLIRDGLLEYEPFQQRDRGVEILP